MDGPYVHLTEPEKHFYCTTSDYISIMCHKYQEVSVIKGYTIQHLYSLYKVYYFETVICFADITANIYSVLEWIIQ